MPAYWKPWLISLLTANMIIPLIWMDRIEAQVVFGVAILNYTTFVVLTGIKGFTRILGLGHIYWIPLIYFLWSRLELFPGETIYGVWLRVVIVLDSGSVILDAANVVRYLHGDREEMA